MGSGAGSELLLHNAVGVDGGGVVGAVNPGPMFRLRQLKGEWPAGRDEVLAALRRGETLGEFARLRGIPRHEFLVFIAEHGEFSEECRRVREFAGTELWMEGVRLVDEAATAVEGSSLENLELAKAQLEAAKAQSKVRMETARAFNRPLFGKQTTVVNVSVDLGERLRRARERMAVIEGEVLPEATKGAI